MFKRIAVFSLFLLMTAFAIQFAIAGGIGVGNQNGFTVDEYKPWYKNGTPSDRGNFHSYNSKDDPDDDRGPAEEDGGVMIWDDSIDYSWMKFVQGGRH